MAYLKFSSRTLFKHKKLHLVLYIGTWISEIAWSVLR